MDGFALLSEIPSPQLPAVIFVTAFDQHALKAFDVAALDYLLKPFTAVRFRVTVQRAQARLASRPRDDSWSKALMELLGRNPAGNSHLTRLSVKTPGRIIFLKTVQISCIESAGNYVAVSVGKVTHIVRDTINGLAERLDPEIFLRISRSFILNLDAFRELLPHFQGQHRRERNSRRRRPAGPSERARVSLGVRVRGLVFCAAHRNTEALKYRNTFSPLTAPCFVHPVFMVLVERLKIYCRHAERGFF